MESEVQQIQGTNTAPKVVSTVYRVLCIRIYFRILTVLQQLLFIYTLEYCSSYWWSEFFVPVYSNADCVQFHF